MALRTLPCVLFHRHVHDTADMKGPLPDVMRYPIHHPLNVRPFEALHATTQSSLVSSSSWYICPPRSGRSSRPSTSTSYCTPQPRRS